MEHFTKSFGMCPTNSSVKWSIQTQNQENTNVGSTPVRKFHWRQLKTSFFLLLSLVKCSITAFALFNSVDLIFSHSTPYGLADSCLSESLTWNWVMTWTAMFGTRPGMISPLPAEEFKLCNLKQGQPDNGKSKIKKQVLLFHN